MRKRQLANVCLAGVVVCVLAGATATRTNALEGLVGACGNPVGTVGDPGDDIAATDALVILNGGVGNVGCVGLICDVNESGGVSATDALLVLNAGVGLPVTLDCPDVANANNCPPASCPCSGGELVNLFQNINGSATYKTQATPNIALLIKCNDLVTPSPTAENPRVIQVPDVDWNKDIAQISANGQLLTAVGQHVVFELTPPCYKRCLGTCSSGPRYNLECTKSSECRGFCTVGALDCDTNTDCTSGGSCTIGTCSLSTVDDCTGSTGCIGGALCSDTNCPNIDAGGRAFLQIKGNDTWVEGLQVRGFYDGFVVTSNNNTLKDLTLDRQCDESFAQGTTGFGTVLSESVLRQGCDKCAQLNEGSATTYNPGANPRPSQCALPTSPAGSDPSRACYHTSIVDTAFEGCKTPIEISPGSSQGNNARVYFGRIDVSEIAGHTELSLSGTQQFACQSTRLNGSNVVGDIVDFNSTGCDVGLSLDGTNAKYTVQAETRIENSEKKGIEILVDGSGASVKIRSSQVHNNAGYENSSQPLAGVGIDQLATADIGADGGANKGNNKLCCNKNGDGTVDRQIQNLTGGLINARGNHWCDVTPAVDNSTGSTTNVFNIIGDPFPLTTDECSSDPRHDEHPDEDDEHTPP